MRCASTRSWSRTPSVASISSSTTSARRTALKALFTMRYSLPFSTLVRLRTPAVSTKVKISPSCSTSASIESRVVPATSETMLRSRPRSRFRRLDLPTLGRPTSATRYTGFCAWRRSSSSVGGAGKVAHIASSASATPLPWMPDMGNGSPRPSFQNSAEPRLCPPSHLFTATKTGGRSPSGMERRKRAMDSSIAVTPARPSTTKRIALASSIAIIACCRIPEAKRWSSSSSKTRPPVSTTLKRCSPQNADW